MFSVKRIALSLSGLGALVVSAYSATLLFGACNANLSCTASVYFGIPQAEIMAPEISTAMRDTSIETSSIEGITASEIHQVIQVVGLYLLLIGVFSLLVLELKELKLLTSKTKRRVAH